MHLRSYFINTFLLGVFLLLCASTLVHAQEASETSDPVLADRAMVPPVPVPREEMREQGIPPMRDARPRGAGGEERREQLSSQMQERFINLGKNVTNRFEALISRFDNISSRIESRMAILEKEGRDVSAARKKLDEAKTSLAYARQTLKSEPTFESVVQSESPRIAIQSVHVRFTAVRDSLRITHVHLQEAVRLLKEPADTTTPEVSPASTNETAETE